MFILPQCLLFRNLQKEFHRVAKALKGASTEVQDKIFRNMSKRTSSMLKEDLEYMGPITFAETEEAKLQILQTLLKLEKERKLKINSLNPSDLIK